MTESTPPSPEEIRRLNRSLLEKVLDKAASDPEWKQQLLDDPDAVINETGFPEVERLRQMQASMESQEAEVIGQRLTMDWACPRCEPMGETPGPTL